MGQKWRSVPGPSSNPLQPPAFPIKEILAMTTSRSKMVSFRLSHEEYESYREACAEVGVRSISELAREALSQLVGTRSNSSSSPSHAVSLRDRVNFLSREVEWLASRLDQIPPAPRGRTAQDRGAALGTGESRKITAGNNGSYVNGDQE